MRTDRAITYMAVALLLVLPGTTWGQTAASRDTYKRFIPAIHEAYLVGLRQGINDAGGMQPSDWAILNDMQRRWDDTLSLLKRRLDERKQKGESVDGSLILATYVALLREHGILCGHPIWADTGTKDHCFEATPNPGR